MLGFLVLLEGNADDVIYYARLLERPAICSSIFDTDFCFQKKTKLNPSFPNSRTDISQRDANFNFPDSLTRPQTYAWARRALYFAESLRQPQLYSTRLLVMSTSLNVLGPAAEAQVTRSFEFEVLRRQQKPRYLLSQDAQDQVITDTLAFQDCSSSV